MFKKKPTVKTLSPLRSSDRRKTADKIIADYAIEVPTAKGPDNDQNAEATSALSTLRKSLLPENALSAKFSTTHGRDLKEVNGIVYVGSHGAGEQRVLWVKIGETLYPSVYTLWKNPRILPLLHTPSFVIGKLKSGADLMTPGLAGPPFPERAKKGALVAIASIEQPSVPVATGNCVIDVASLKTTQGAKGHAVETFHWAGDDLWDWSTSGKAGVTAPTEIPEWLTDSSEQLAERAADLQVNDEEDEDEGGIALQPNGTEDSKAPAHNDFVEGEDASAAHADSGGEKMTTADIDDAFYNAFLFGIHQQKRNHSTEENFGLNFPLLQSLVMSQLVLPFLPTFTAAQSSSLQIKKTSWKNARKFIMNLDKKKLVLAKETKNEAIVRDIDFDDRAFREFTPYRLPKKEPLGGGANATGQAPQSTSNESDNSVGQTLRVETLYKPKDNLSPFFEGVEGIKPSYCTAAQVRHAVTEYVQSHQLLVPNNRRLVTLDPLISNVILSTSNAVDKDVLAKGSIPRDALVGRVLGACSTFHTILRNAESLESSTTKPKAGPPPKIGIIVETRGGNKTATRVYGFEPYSVSAQPLADELRKSCAGSTSVEPFKGGRGMEVMVQGPQQDAVVKALERRGVNKAWIEVLDKTKAKKK